VVTPPGTNPVISACAKRAWPRETRAEYHPCYADLLGMQASESPQEIIPLSLIVTSYHPDIVIYNETCNLVALLALWIPFMITIWSL